MNVGDLKALRDRAGITQAEMADLIGLSHRAYQDVEAGASKLRNLHALAVERVSLALALSQGNIDLALPSVRRDALSLAAMIRGE